MIHALTGTLRAKRPPHVIVAVSGVEFRVFVSPRTITTLPETGTAIHLYTDMYWRADSGPELYGFTSEDEQELFVRLLSVSGVGPKSALAMLGVAPLDQVVGAINEGRAELLTRVSGVGRKTAERVILDLKGKLTLTGTPKAMELMESDAELEETLVGLGYTRVQAREAIDKIDPKLSTFKDRLKAALKKKEDRNV